MMVTTTVKRLAGTRLLRVSGPNVDGAIEKWTSYGLAFDQHPPRHSSHVIAESSRFGMRFKDGNGERRYLRFRDLFRETEHRDRAELLAQQLWGLGVLIEPDRFGQTLVLAVVSGEAAIRHVLNRTRGDSLRVSYLMLRRVGKNRWSIGSRLS